MKLFFSRIIRAIERNSRANERRKLTQELEQINHDREWAAHRVRQILDRLNVLGKADLDSYLNRNKPVKSVSQMIEEDDCGVPDGLVGEWKAPV